MLKTLVKPNNIIEREPQNILVFQQRQGNMPKITLKLQWYMIICPESFSIAAKGSRNFKLEINKSILIKLLKPILSKNISSVPLYLF